MTFVPSSLETDNKIFLRFPLNPLLNIDSGFKKKMNILLLPSSTCIHANQEKLKVKSMEKATTCKCQYWKEMTK